MSETQRTFIYLRQCSGGRESGYARMEPREGKIAVNTVVQGFDPNAEAYVFFYGAEDLRQAGKVRLDNRGQGGLALELNHADWQNVRVVLIAQITENSVRIPLVGILRRGADIDWEALKAEIEQIFFSASEPEILDQEESVQNAPEQNVIIPEEEPEPSLTIPEENVQEETASTPEENPETEAEYEELSPPAEPHTIEYIPEKKREEMAESDLYDQPAQNDSIENIERELRTPLPQETRGELPQSLQSVYWPQVLWPLHDLFERFEAVASPGGEENITCVRVPLNGAMGETDHYLLGAQTENGWVVGAGYYIPGKEQSKPPAELSGYFWSDGYWQAWQHVDPIQKEEK